MQLEMHLVLFETSGNQRYIFDTNKLVENLGASELTARAGTTWVLEAVGELTGKPAPAPNGIAEHLESPEKNPRIEDDSRAEVIIAASGKALVLVREREDAERLVWQVTSRALAEAPGLDLCGAVSDRFDWSNDSIHEVSLSLYRAFGGIRAGRAGPVERFPGIPIGARCATSGLPAGVLDRRAPEGVPMPRSVSIMAARAAAEAGRQRMGNLLDADVARTIDDLETAFERLDWLGVVHADGNGVGAIFVDFYAVLEKAGLLQESDLAKRNRCYVDALRRFSLALDETGVGALRDALAEMGAALAKMDARRDRLVVPIVLGGDDVTLLCDGRLALDLAVAYLRAFECRSADRSTRNGILADIAEAASGAPRLGACAGVAIVKPHYPFSAAYDLAEELTASAKQVKRHAPVLDGRSGPVPCSAIDFHILFDAGATDLHRLRSLMTADDGKTRLYTRPYVITPAEDRPETTPAEGQPETSWFEGRGWEHLETRVNTLQARDDDGRRRLPSSQTHDLRAGLFLGRDEAEFRFRLLRDRYPDAADLADGPECSLFTDDAPSEAGVVRTSFLDAMEAAEFLLCGGSTGNGPSGDDPSGNDAPSEEDRIEEVPA
ncbi:Cas10/Cmr2 second palm domain-containing protein [Rhabdothermincola sp.]|uniref:Cas10/Cmr2 second palm domain-containing protein n=1 Tax=Rhabdothermincola sp. TaxID=2820405 RepID=UPI002FE30B11